MRKFLNKNIILFLLTICLIIPVLSSSVVTHAATGESSEGQYIYYLETGEMYDLTWTIINKALVSYRSSVGLSEDDTVYFIVYIHTGNYTSVEQNIWIKMSNSPFTLVSASASGIVVTSSSDVYQIRYYTEDGGFSYDKITTLFNQGNSHTMTLDSSCFICSSHTVKTDSGAVVFNGVLDTAFDSPGFSYETMVGIEDYTSNLEELRQEVMNEVLVTEEEEPNVFLRIFKNIANITVYIALQLYNLSQKVFEFVDTFLTNLPTILEESLSGISEVIEEIKEFIFDIVNKFRDMLIDFAMTVWTMELIDGVSFNSIWEFFQDKMNTVGEYITGLQSGEISMSDIIISALPDRLEELINGFYNLGYSDMEFSLHTMFQNLLVPEDGYIEDKIDTVVLSKFGFIQTGYAFLDSVKSVLNQTDTVMPIITTDTFTWNGVTIPSFTISFEWYEDFKPYVDPVVSAFCWITFMHHTMVNLPSLFRGGSVAGNAFKDYMVDVDTRNRASSDADKIARNYGWK